MNRIVATRFSAMLGLAFLSLFVGTAGHAVADTDSIVLVLHCESCPPEVLDVLAAGVGPHTIASGDRPTPERLDHWARTVHLRRALWVGMDVRPVRRNGDDWASHVAAASARVVLWSQPSGIIWRETFDPVRGAHFDQDRAGRVALRAAAERVAKATLNRRALSGHPVNPTANAMIGGVERLVAQADAALAARPRPDSGEAFDTIQSLERKAETVLSEAFRHPTASPSRLGPALSRNESYQLSVSNDRRLWSMSYVAETGGHDDAVSGGHYRWNDGGALVWVEMLDEDYHNPNDSPASLIHVADLRFKSGTLYLMRKDNDGGTCQWQVSMRVMRLDESGLATVASLVLPRRRYPDYELSLQTPPGGPIQRVRGLPKGVVVFDFGYAAVNEGDSSLQAIDARDGCPDGSKAVVPSESKVPLPDDADRKPVCWVKGRYAFDGEQFLLLDTNGECDEGLSPALVRFCKSTR